MASQVRSVGLFFHQRRSQRGSRVGLQPTAMLVGVSTARSLSAHGRGLPSHRPLPTALGRTTAHGPPASSLIWPGRDLRGLSPGAGFRSRLHFLFPFSGFRRHTPPSSESLVTLSLLCLEVSFGQMIGFLPDPPAWGKDEAQGQSQAWS